MTSSGPRACSDRALDHLLADLSADAQIEWQAVAARGGGRRPGGLHEWLHGRLGAVGRRLRQSRPGAPLHAGGCRLPDGRGLLVVGRTRSGKSTLSVLLGVRLGANVFSDDMVWVDGGSARGFGAPVTIRNDSPWWSRARTLWYADDGERMLARLPDLGAPAAPTSAVTADVVVFPRLTEADAAVRELEPAETFCRLVDALRGPCTPDSMGNLAALAARCPATTLDAPDLATSERLLDAWTAATRSQRTSFEPVDAAELAAAGFGNDVGAFRFGDDVALWSSAAGKTVHIRGWAGPLVVPPALTEQLGSLGLLALPA